MADFSAYPGLFAGYGTMVGLTLLAVRFGPRVGKGDKPLWPAQESVEVAKPWLELGLAFLGVVGIIAAGQVYQQGWLLPIDGRLGWLAEAMNQFLIFSPMLLYLAIRRQHLKTALLPSGRAGLRLAAGCVLAVVAVSVLASVRHGFGEIVPMFASFAAPETAAHVVQVFMEDVAIAVLLVRLAAALGGEWRAVVLVAVLFAAAHIPAMIGNDATAPADFAMRGLDVLIGVMVVGGLLKTRDLLWFYPVHLAMDLTQFYSG